ncbi:AAA family ATPase [Mycoplasmatota bacterium WC44]
MKLVYVWVYKYMNLLEQQAFPIDANFSIDFTIKDKSVTFTINDQYSIRHKNRLHSVTAIIGKNGSGKSTFFHLMNGVDGNNKDVLYFYLDNNNEMQILCTTDLLDEITIKIQNNSQHVKGFKFQTRQDSKYLGNRFIIYYNFTFPPFSNPSLGYSDSFGSTFSSVAKKAEFPSQLRFIARFYELIEFDIPEKIHIMVKSNQLHLFGEIKDLYDLLYKKITNYHFRKESNFDFNTFLGRFKLNAVQLIFSYINLIGLSVFRGVNERYKEYKNYIETILEQFHLSNENSIWDHLLNFNLDYIGSFNHEPVYIGGNIKKHLLRVKECARSADDFIKFYEEDENSHMLEKVAKWVVPTHSTRVEELSLHLKNNINLIEGHWDYITKGETKKIQILSTIYEEILSFEVQVNKYLDEYTTPLKSIVNTKAYNMILFLDEPDENFHPEWSRSLLNDLIKGIDCILERSTFCDSNINSYQLILSSHSPFIVSDLPTNNIITLTNERGKIKVNEDIHLLSNGKTFAGNIHTILSEKFFLERMIGEYAYNLLEDLKCRIESLTEKSTLDDHEYIKYVINNISEPLILEFFNQLYKKSDDSIQIGEK